MPDIISADQNTDRMILDDQLLRQDLLGLSVLHRDRFHMRDLSVRQNLYLLQCRVRLSMTTNMTDTNIVIKGKWRLEKVRNVLTEVLHASQEKQYVKCDTKVIFFHNIHISLVINRMFFY